MVFRAEVVRKKLDHLDRVLKTLLKARSSLTREILLSNVEEQWKVERGLQLACQLVLDVGP